MGNILPLACLGHLLLVNAALSQQIVWQINGTASYEVLGECGVLGMGDVDGDSIEDFATGAAGQVIQRVMVVSGATGLPVWTITHPTPWERYGWIINSGGDVNGDGVRDLIVGVRDYRDPQGVVVGATLILSGSDGQTLRQHIGTVAAPIPGTAGPIVGDVDVDGYDDYVLFESRVFIVGLVTLRSGRTGNTLRSWSGLLDAAGWATPIGDIDDDGHDEVLFSEAGCTTSISVCYGAAACYSGRTGALLYRAFGDAATPASMIGFSGWTCAGADLNGDGVPDFVAAADTQYTTNGPDLGMVRAYSGVDGSILWTRYGGPLLGDRLGWGLSSGDDWNGDGHSDVFALHLRPSETIDVLSGVDGSTLLSLVSNPWAASGWGRPPLGVAGDLNGDGLREILASGNTLGTPLTNPGTVFVFSLGSGPVAYRLPHGRACPASNGYLPHLVLQTDPRLGRTARVVLRGTVAGSIAGLMIGFPVPGGIDMSPFGALGCSLYVDPFWLSAISSTDNTGVSARDVPVPLIPALAGVVLEGQWFVVDPSANAAGVILSTGIRLMLGS